MVLIEIPIWMAILILVCFIVILIYFILGDLFTRWLHQHYHLEIKERKNKHESTTKKN